MPTFTPTLGKSRRAASVPAFQESQLLRSSLALGELEFSAGSLVGIAGGLRIGNQMKFASESQLCCKTSWRTLEKSEERCRPQSPYL